MIDDNNIRITVNHNQRSEGKRKTITKSMQAKVTKLNNTKIFRVTIEREHTIDIKVEVEL